jgi:hypothetical protein
LLDWAAAVAALLIPLLNDFKSGVNESCSLAENKVGTAWRLVNLAWYALKQAVILFNYVINYEGFT